MGRASRFFICILSVVCLLQNCQAADRPNILFIFLDDYGWRDAGFMGSDFYETPHIDKLANEGMVFTNAYAGAANCAPSRACLLSGQYSPRHEIYNVGTGPRRLSTLLAMIVLSVSSLHQGPLNAEVSREIGTGTFLPSNRVDSRGIQRARELIAKGEYSQSIRFLDATVDSAF